MSPRSLAPRDATQPATAGRSTTNRRSGTLQIHRPSARPNGDLSPERPTFCQGGLCAEGVVGVARVRACWAVVEPAVSGVALRSGPGVAVAERRWISTRTNTTRQPCDQEVTSVQRLTTRSASPIRRATSGGDTHVPPTAARSSSVTARAIAHPFQTNTGNEVSRALVIRSRRGAIPRPSTASRTCGANTSDASPSSTMPVL